MTIAAGQKMYAEDILNLTFFPIGAILQFSGSEYGKLTSAKTEDGKVIWTLCNGISVNGIAVPNLVNKFLRGGSSSGTTAGADSVTLTEQHIPRHTHELSNIAVTGGDHDHTFTGSTSSTSKVLTGSFSAGENNVFASGIVSRSFSNQIGTNSGDHDNDLFSIDATHSHGVTGTIGSRGHSHTISGSISPYGQGGTAVPTVPSYYSVVYIMKVA